MRKFCFLFLLLAVLNLYGQEYAAVRGKLVTAWGEKVTPANVWQEYPRPQMKRGEWQNLNGLWEYAIIAKEASKPAIFQGNILVPFAVESALSGVGKSVLPDQKVWYRRNFTVPGSWSGKQVILHFQAVDFETAVWVNGKLAGTHTGGSTAFSFNITKLLTKGNQEIVVSVWDPTDTGDQARGKQVLDPRGIWYTPVTGIWQTVWMEPVGGTSISSVYPVSDIDRGTITVNTGITGSRGNEELRVKVLSNGSVVGEKNYPASEPGIFNIPSPKLWSPDSPSLYQLEVSLYRNNVEVDKVDSYFAMRKISMVKDGQGFQRLQLNNRTFFQYGTLDQGWWPDGLLTPPSAEGMRYDIEVLKSMGFNMLRKHIKVEPWLYYYYADSMGILLWQDMPSGFETADRANQHVAWDSPADWARPAESAKQWEYELKQMIDQLRFFPSIVTWVIFNEGWGQYETRRVVEWSMEYDKTRLINGVSGWTDRDCGHFIDAHQYPGPGMEPAGQNPGRVVVLGEFGGLGLPVENHLWNPKMRNWGYRTYSTEPELIKEYAKLIHNLVPLRHKGLAAAVYTQTSDVEGEVNGLLTYDRKVIKIDPALLRILHAPLYSNKYSHVNQLISDSEEKTQQIRVTKTKPGSGWTVRPADGGFALKQAPVDVNKGETIWYTGSFDLMENIEGLSLKILSYGVTKVWLNGNLVLDTRIVSKRHYEEFNISEFSHLLRTGTNLIAVEGAEFEVDSQFDFGVYTY